MPIARFQLPDGRIAKFEVPEGTTPEQAQSMMAEHFSGRGAFTPGKMGTPVSQRYDPTEGMSGAEKFLAGAGKAFMDLYRGGKQLFVKPGGELQAEIDESKRLDAPLMNTAAGLAGNVTGNLALTLPASLNPATASIRGASMLGTVMGLLSPTSSEENKLTSAAIGAAGGALGQGTANVIGRAAEPVRNALTPRAQRLAATAEAMGIPLSVGQATGSKPVQIAESVLQNIPFFGGKIMEQRQIQRDAFDRAVSRTFGENAADFGPDIMRAAKSRIGGEFENAFKNTKIPSSTLKQKLEQLEAEAGSFLPPAESSILSRHISDLMSKVDDNGDIAGKAYQAWRTKINNQATSTGDRWFGNQLAAVRNAADKEAYAAVSDPTALRLAREQYKNMKIVEPLAEKAVRGDLSHGLMLSRVRSEVPDFAYGGGGDLANLARIGSAFVKDPIPDSGTAQRLLMQRLMTGGAIGGLGLYGMTDPESAAKTLGIGAGVSGLSALALTNPTSMRYLIQGLGPTGTAAVSSVAQLPRLAGLLAPVYAAQK